MSVNPYTEPSRRLAHEMPPGEHPIYDNYLRDAFGVAHVTPMARTAVAEELERAGLQIVSDPAHEPLMVRKLDRAPAAAAPARPWWRRGWAIGVGAVLILLLLVGVASGPTDDDEPENQGGAPQTEATTTEEKPTETLADAQEAVDDDDYTGALAIAAALGDDEKNQIARRISRRIGKRALRALAKGDRGKARRLLKEAKAEDYPSTSALRTAQSRYDLAVAQARERAEAKRQARREARAQERAEERARQEEEEAAQAPDPAPSDEGSAPDASGPSTTNWCGKRDGDGDGIYCEGE